MKKRFLSFILCFAFLPVFLGAESMSNEEFFVLFNNKISEPSKKLVLINKKSNIKKLGYEEMKGDISGKVIYDGKIKGFGGHISLKYENYCDKEGWIFNGEIITKSNIAGNGTFEGCIEVSGLYSAKIYYDNIKLADSIPSEGTYGVELKDSAREEVPYTLYFEKL